MSNNEPDYDNLAFEPEMTYEDVFKLAVDKYNYTMCSDEDYIFISKKSFNGRRWLFNNNGFFLVDLCTIKNELEPYKIKQLILALE